MSQEQHDALKVGDTVKIVTGCRLMGLTAQVERTHQGNPPCIMVIRHDWACSRGFWPHELEVA